MNIRELLFPAAETSCDTEPRIRRIVAVRQTFFRSHLPLIQANLSGGGEHLGFLPVRLCAAQRVVVGGRMPRGTPFRWARVPWFFPDKKRLGALSL